MKIRTKINLILIIGFAIIILALGGIIGFVSSRQLRALNENFISKINNAKAEQIKMFLKGEQEVVLSLSASTVFRDFLKIPENSAQYNIEKSRTEQRLKRSIASVQQIQELFILDKNGKIVASTITANDGQDKSQDPYFVNGKNGIYFKSFYFSDITKTNAYAVSAPIIDDTSKELLGVVVARMYPENLYMAVGAEIPDTQTGENFLIDSNYFLISPGRYLTKKDVLAKKIETQNAKDCFSKEEIESSKIDSDQIHINHDILSQYTDYRGVAIIGTHHYIPETGWCLITKEDLSETLAPSYYLLRIFIIIAVTFLVIFVIVSVYISSGISKNIVRLKKGAQAIEEGNLDIKVSINSKDEVGDLSRSFDKMAQAVKDSRKEIDLKVQEQTKEIKEKQKDLEDQQKAVLNILEDVELEKSKTEALLSGIGEGVIATDINAKIIFINNAATDILGWKSEEVIGKSIYDILYIFDEKGKKIAEDLRPFHLALELNQKVFARAQDGYYYTKKNGEKFPVAVSVTPVVSGGKLIGAINVFSDITHEKQVDKAKTEFVSLASHQLRTPLSTINWYSEMLLAGDAGKINKKQKKFLEEIYAGNKRMVELVNALLNVSRLELGTLSVEPVDSDLVALAKQTIGDVLPQMKEKKQKFTEDYDSNLPKINVDPKLMNVIFQNLLSNSMKYTPEKGEISLEIKNDKNGILIKVQDTGYGIPEDAKTKIFEKLYRADNVKEKDANGSGLGLYLVKFIIEQSGGKIWFDSQINKGTTFYVLIPFSGMRKKEGTKKLS